jgi:hypothetical protein
MPSRLITLMIGVMLLSSCGSSQPSKTAVASPTDARPFRNNSKSTEGTRLGIGTAPATIDLIAGEGDLGNADFGETRQATFRLKNLASTNAKLRITDKSCTCAGIHIADPDLAVGKETDIVLSWTPKVEVLESSQARIWAEIIEEKSGHRLRLEATGNIDPLLHVSFPRGPLDFGKLAPADLDTATRVIEVFCKQTGFEQPVTKLNQPGLELASTEPLTQDRLTELQAKAGYRLTVRPTKKLSHGAFQTELTLSTSIKKMPLLIPITGEFDTSTISLSQSRWQLPPKLSLKQGYKLPAITLDVRFGTCTACEVQSIQPSIFEGKVTKVSDKSWKIELQLINDEAALQKKMSAEALQTLMEQGFEQGMLTLKLNHPEVPSISIPIGGTQLFRE